jgi:polysaccharide chain length determinant protein (PEP-CTERM system associated)
MSIQALTPHDLMQIVFKRKWWILASVVVCVSLAGAAWTFSTKLFKATVVVTIDSPRIAKEYVKGLSPTQEGRYNDDPAAIIMQQVSLGLTNKSILMPVLETLKPYSDAGAQGQSPDQLMKRLRKAIVVGKPKERDGGVGVGIAISFTHTDPHMAQAVATALAVQLQEDNLTRREGVVEMTTEFLSVELERVKGDLEVKERAISDFKRAYMGELPQQMDANLRTLERLQTDLTNTTESLNRSGDRLNALEKSIREFSDNAQAGPAMTERDRRIGDNRPIDPRVVKLRELKQKLQELLGTYKDSYPDVIQTRQEIRQLESMLQLDVNQSGVNEPAAGKADDGGAVVRKLTDPYLRELMIERSDTKREIVALKERQTHDIRQIQEIEARIERIPAREQKLAVLLRDQENMQRAYQSLLDKRTNARILSHYENQQFGEQYRIIEAATLPAWPEPPNQLHFMLGGLLVGCLLGFGSAIGVEFMKTGFRRPEEVEKYLGLPVIASIPAFSSVTSGVGIGTSLALLNGPGIPARLPVGAPSYRGGQKMGANGKVGNKGYVGAAQSLPPKFHLITKWVPASLMAEQYRVAATRLVIMTSEKRNAVTLVTSSVMGEGKTTTAANLAYILAHDLNKSTLLIDCDFKRPMVHDYMGVPAGPGIGDVLHGGEILENCIHQYDGGVPLWILPTGSSKVRPAGLSGIQYVKNILPDLRARYDHVILDAPPVLPLADVNALSGLADMTVFIVRAGRTSQDIAKKALDTLGESTEVAGIVLTQVEMEYAPYLMYAAAYTNEDVRNHA